MKTIGTLNFHFSSDNFGAVLVAFSLKSILKLYNYNSISIDYIPD